MAVVRRVLVSGVWLLIWLALIDLGLWVVTNNFARGIPQSLERYLSYGHSQQSKLQDITGTKEGEATSVALAGWLDTKPHTKPAAANALCLSVYGMSFSEHLGELLQEQGARPGETPIALRMASGPAAPPNWTYAAALQDRGHGECEDVVVWTILSSSIKGMDALSSQTWQFDQPFPFTYPKYVLNEAGDLSQIDPKIQTVAEMQEALQSPESMTNWTTQMAADDAYYHPALYGLRALDASTLFGFARRGFSRSWLEEQTKVRVANDAALRDSRILARLEAMAKNFTAVVRAEGKLPVILLIQARNEPTDVGAMLCERDANLPLFSTRVVVDPHNTSAYQPDGHFHSAPRRAIAAAFAEHLQALKSHPATCRSGSVKQPMAQ